MDVLKLSINVAIQNFNPIDQDLLVNPCSFRPRMPWVW